ncbi:GFA family protein [Erythrobacter sp. HA6-11]
MEVQTGGCSCGHVRYHISAPPLALYLCHCTDCQRRTGSAFGMTMHIPSSRHVVTQGKLLNIGSDKFGVFVCSQCSSWIYNKHNKAVVTVFPPGTLDDTSGLKPDANIWTRSAQPWVKFDPALDNYEKQPLSWTELYPKDWAARCGIEGE